MRPGVAAGDDQIADVGNPGEEIGKNENGIAPIQPVGEQEERPDQTQPPKAGGHHDFFVLLGGVPLDEKPGKEDGIAAPSDDFPEMPLDSKEFSPVPDEVLQPVHRRKITQRRFVGKCLLRQ